jgi:uncharacterized OsmC-like protein
MSIKAKYVGEFQSEIIFENQLKIKTNSNRNLHDSCKQTKPSNLLSASLACCISTTLGIILERITLNQKVFMLILSLKVIFKIIKFQPCIVKYAFHLLRN